MGLTRQKAHRIAQRDRVSPGQSGSDNVLGGPLVASINAAKRLSLSCAANSTDHHDLRPTSQLPRGAPNTSSTFDLTGRRRHILNVPWRAEMASATRSSP